VLLFLITGFIRPPSWSTIHIVAISSSKTLLSMAEKLGDFINQSEGWNSTNMKKKFLHLQLTTQATKQANRL
jgi:hypothetical protein